MNPPSKKQGDSLEACRKKCTSIKHYWAWQGYDIKAWPSRVEVPCHPRSFYYVIRSSLVNGLPEGYSLHRAEAQESKPAKGHLVA